MDQLKSNAIQTARLRLRPVTLDDAEAVLMLRSDPGISCWSLSGGWTELSKAIEWIQNMVEQPAKCAFAIELVEPDPQDQLNVNPPCKVIGTIGTGGDKEIGYMVLSRYWRRGYATEALAAFVKAWQASFPDDEWLKARTDVENIASRRTLEKCGFLVVGSESYGSPDLGSREATVYKVPLASKP